MSSESQKQMAYTDWLCLAFKSKLKILNMISVLLSTANNQSTRSPLRLQGEGAGAVQGTGMYLLQPAPRTGALSGEIRPIQMADGGAQGSLPCPASRGQGSPGPQALPSSPGPPGPLPRRPHPTSRLRIGSLCLCLVSQESSESRLSGLQVYWTCPLCSLPASRT